MTDADIGSEKANLAQAGEQLEKAEAYLDRNPFNRPDRKQLVNETADLLSQLVLNLGSLHRGVGEDRETIGRVSAEITESKELVSGIGAAATLSVVHEDMIESTNTMGAGYDWLSERYSDLEATVEQLSKGFGEASLKHRAVLASEEVMGDLTLPQARSQVEQIRAKL